jgi:hypothetical protein
MTSNGMYNEFLRYFERVNELYNGYVKRHGKDQLVIR